jgi:predicted AlkP superfamily pyrophosphatase or phosphodiesterase
MRFGEGRTLNSDAAKAKPYVILVSLDGYRWDYVDLYSPPFLKVIKDEGASAQSLIPVYPSKTFTNHYSIATGLYADHHGIVSNHFYDPTRSEEFILSDRNKVQDGSWYFGSPLWVAAEKQGLLTASYFWPGSEAKIQNIQPTYYFNYDSKKGLAERVVKIKEWLELPEDKRPHLITFYVSDVDSAGHKFGPQSPEVKAAVLKVDEALKELCDLVKATSIPVNIVIVSDHGMQEVSRQNIEYIDDYVDLKGIKVIGDGTQLQLYSEDKAKILRLFRALREKGKHFKVYTRETIPPSYHYSETARVGDIVVIVDSPYLVTTRNPPYKFNVGVHGYDPDKSSNMHGIFYAFGPQIKTKKVIPSFRNIHVYPFIMKLLELNVQDPVDGNDQVYQLLHLKQ